MPEEGGDTRVLNMRINNKEFLKGTSDSLKAVNTLNTGIDKATKGKGMQSMGTQVDTVKTKFGAMQVAGVTALATITNKAVNAGLLLVKGLAIDPVMAGFREYEKLLTSTQTIAANTNNRSSAGIAKVGLALDELNRYSDRTIYNFGQMAENAGRFTAAGVGLKDAVSSIKGLANAAALAGASNMQLGTAMYQTSQALGTGVIKLMDWRSLENANLGTKNMRDALLATAHSMDDNGVAADAAISKYGNFRDSLREGWVTAGVFNKTMKVFAGTVTDGGKPIAYTVKQLREMGYSKDAAIRLRELSAASIESATKIKTFSQLIDVVKESMGSGWAKIFRDLFGDLDEAGKMWTKVGGVITDIVSDIFGTVDRMLVQWKDLGGFKEAWGALGNIFQSVSNLLHPFLVLLGAISPGTDVAGGGLYAVTHVIYLFSIALEKVTSLIGKSITPAFKVIGKATGYLVDKVKELVAWFSQFGYAIAPLGPAFDRFGASVKKAFAALFDGDFSGFGKQISAAFSSLWKEGVFAGTNLVEGIKAGLGVNSIEAAIQGLVDRMVNFFKNLLGIHSPSTVFEGFGHDIVAGLTNGLSSGEGSIGASLSKMFGSIDKFDVANTISAVFSVAVLAAIIKLIYEFTTALSAIGKIGKNFSKMLDEVGNTLEAMQTALKAQALKDIAIAIGILALSLWLLSKLSYPELIKGLAAIGTALLMMTKVMDSLAANEANTAKGIASILGISAAMVLLSTAVLLLSVAVAAFGMMPTDVLVKGIISIAIVLGILAGISFLVGKASPHMILASAGILIISIALGVLAVSMAAMLATIMLFERVDLGKMMNGLGKMALVLIGVGLAAALLSVLAPGLLIASVALGLLSVTLSMMLGTIMMFAAVDLKTIASGAGKIAAALIIIGLASLIAAPGLLMLGVALGLIGLGLLAAGLGLTLAGAGLTVLAAAGTAAGAVFITFIESFLALLPLMGIQFIAAIDVILRALAEKAPSFVDSMVIIVTEMLRGISELAPVIAQTGIDILVALLNGIVSIQQKLYDTGLKLLMGFLQYIHDRMELVINAGKAVIKKFIEGLSDLGELAEPAGAAILEFLTAIESAIDLYAERIADAGVRIGVELAAGIIKGTSPGNILKAIKDELLGSGSSGSGKKTSTNIDGGEDIKGSKYAQGTDYARGGLSLVGELGPELVSLNRGSKVITNKNLVGFMKAVSKFVRVIVNNSGGSTDAKDISAGANIKFVVNSDFRGDPRKDGVAFAANIAAGLISGLKAQQSGINSTMATVGQGMSSTFSDILGIKSPSTVFYTYATYVAQGFINGLLASTSLVQSAAERLGQAAIDGIAKTVTDSQLKLEAVRAQADAYEAAIEQLRKDAEDESDSTKKKIEARIAELQKLADAARIAADAEVRRVEAEQKAAERQKEFEEADLERRAEIRKEDAAEAAQNASIEREQALRLKLEADLIRNFESKYAAILDQQAKDALARAQQYAGQADALAKESYDLAQQAKAELDALMAAQLQTVTEVDVANAQAAFEAYLKSVADAQSAAIQDQTPQNVTFEQNNYSPEAISAADAYRNGKSLVSIMERKLVPTP